MKQHYNINELEWSKLIYSGVSTMDLLKSIPEFDATGNGAPITKVCLLHYLDKHGDFDRSSAHGKIAFAVFNSLSNEDKTDVIRYMEDEDD